MDYEEDNKTQITNSTSYDKYIGDIKRIVNINSEYLKENKTYSDSLNKFKNNATNYANSIITSNRTLNTQNDQYKKDKINLLEIYNKEYKEFSGFSIDESDITSHENYIKTLTTHYNKLISKGEDEQNAMQEFKNFVNSTYSKFEKVLNDIYKFHDNCTSLINKYGVCSIFYDKYLNTMNSSFIKLITNIQEYRIIRVNYKGSNDSSDDTSVNENAFFLVDISEQSNFSLSDSNIQSMLAVKNDSLLNDIQRHTKMLYSYAEDLKIRRQELMKKTINTLDKILTDNCNFILTSPYSQFNKYTLDTNKECAIEYNDIHQLMCIEFLYILFNNLEKIKNEIKTANTTTLNYDLSKSLKSAFSEIDTRRSIHEINIMEYDQKIYIRLPYLINYCELIQLYDTITRTNKNSFGIVIYRIFSEINGINITAVKDNSSNNNQKKQKEGIYDTMFKNIVKEYIRNFNIIAFHTDSSKVLSNDYMDDVNLANIKYNISNNNTFVKDIELCAMNKSQNDTSTGSGKIKLSMFLCYTALLFSIIFNVLMFVFKEKIRNKFNSPTSSKIINNVFYWVNLSCIVAAGLSSFLRITDVYSTSFFKRIGVIVTVNVITMIFCSFSLYFIDPNTFWNTTAKTKETKNTENNKANANTDANANDNANANQSSSN